MKKTTLHLIAVLVAAIVLSSCGGVSKMVDNANAVQYVVTPSPLEMHAGKVKVKITGKFPAKYFNKKATLTLTPVLKYEGGEAAMKAVSVQGEGVQGNFKVISNAEGGSFEYEDVVDFVPGMMKSELVLRGSIMVKTKSYPVADLKIADGVLATPSLAVNKAKVVFGEDKFQRVTANTVSAEIKYLIQKYDVRPGELKKEEIKKLEAYLAEITKNQSIALKNIEVNSYASPDGATDLNEKIVKGRKTSAQGYISKTVKKSKLVAADTIYRQLATTEDWDGFQNLVKSSDIQDKDLILRVLSMYNDPEVREKEIKNMAATFEVLAEKILPELRRSELKLNVEVTGYSDEQLVAIVDSAPAKLNVEEILYAAKLLTDADKKLTAYQKAAELFPSDWRTKNNLGVMQFVKGSYADAKASFEAAKATQDNDIVNNNIGACIIMTGDLKAAEDVITGALGAGQAANYNLGLIKMMNADYEAAVNYFGATCDNNAGLANMLKGNNDAALKNLECIEENDAVTYYLKAIIGARTQNENLLWTNLRTAIGKDASYKAYAKKDLEFRSYFENATFKEVVQ